jgi:hypothetical protein
MEPEEAMFREFELIQDVIERQANNSFRIKGWTVTLVVVALIFRTNDFQLFGAFIPLIGFWGLDAYFLQQEKQYRMLYDWVRENRPENDDRRFDLDASRFEDCVRGVPGMMRSPTLLAFYGSIGVLLALYSIVVFSVNGGSVLG